MVTGPLTVFRFRSTKTCNHHATLDPCNIYIYNLINPAYKPYKPCKPYKPYIILKPLHGPITMACKSYHEFYNSYNLISDNLPIPLTFVVSQADADADANEDEEPARGSCKRNLGGKIRRPLSRRVSRQL